VIRLSKTFIGEMPESMTATPTPAPRVPVDQAPIVLRRTDALGAVDVTWNDSVGASIDTDSTFELCAIPSSAWTGISTVTASMSGCSALTP
jgi:hypothetical protein